MVATNSGFASYKYLQTTDGVNDYYLGTDGTNSFSITPFAARVDMTFNVLINFTATVDSSTVVARMLEVANSARTSIYGNDLGAFTNQLTNEHMGLFTSLAGTVRSAGVVTGSITAGWHMITISIASAVITMCVDGIIRAKTDGSFGPPVNATSGFTANKLSLMGTTVGSAVFGCTWREAMILTVGWSAANALLLYNYYTRDGNVSLAKSRRSAWRYMVTPTARGQIVALWKGNESGTNLLESKTSASNLTKTNF